MFFGGIVVTGVYEYFGEWSYLVVGLISAVPPIVLPLFFPKLSGEQGIPWYERYTTKANTFVFMAAWIGNYFWTHYFYKVLGTGYSMPAHRLNDVPFALYLITHSYFLGYHLTASILLRKLWKRMERTGYSYKKQLVIVSLIIIASCYFVALFEVATIASFPYYYYKSVFKMWVIGSGFYGIYFLFSFPMFHRIDEYFPGFPIYSYKKRRTDPDFDASPAILDGLAQGYVGKEVSHGETRDRHYPYRFTLTNVFKDILAWGMGTTMLLDAWRLLFGSLDDIDVSSLGVSWIYLKK